MSRQPQRIFIKPRMTDVGRGPELSLVPFRRSGVAMVLQAAGEWVQAQGSEGGFWKRRIAEGSVEIAEPPAEPAPTPAPVNTNQGDDET